MSSFATIILAAGEGKRMKSRIPKALHTVCGKPMVSIVCEAARTAGHDPIIVVVRDASSDLVGTLGTTCEYAFQTQPLGTGDALFRARDAVRDHDNILVMNADIPLIQSSTLAALAEAHLRSEVPVTMLTAKVDKPDGLGRVVRDPAGQVSAVVEHLEANTKELSLREINAGVYCFRSDWLWDSLPHVQASATGEIYLTHLIGMAANSGLGVATYCGEDPTEALGVNTRVELATAESVMRKRIREQWMLQGVSMPDPTSVYIDCDVEMGVDTVVQPNTHIRGVNSNWRRVRDRSEFDH